MTRGNRIGVLICDRCGQEINREVGVRWGREYNEASEIHYHIDPPCDPRDVRNVTDMGRIARREDFADEPRFDWVKTDEGWVKVADSDTSPKGLE